MNNMMIIRIIRLLRLAKLARILRAGRMFERWETKMVFKYRDIALIRFIVIVLLVVHWLACLWRLVLEFEETEDVPLDPVPNDPNGPAWLLASHSDLKKTDAFDLYVICIYWSFCTVSSVGYGDVANPNNTLERIVALFCMSIGSFIWAYVIGAICGVVQTLDEDINEFHDRMDSLGRFCDTYSLPPQLRSNLKEYFNQRNSMKSTLENEGLVQELSPTLQGQVAMHCVETQGWITKVPWMIDARSVQ